MGWRDHHLIRMLMQKKIKSKIYSLTSTWINFCPSTASPLITTGGFRCVVEPDFGPLDEAVFVFVAYTRSKAGRERRDVGPPPFPVGVFFKANPTFARLLPDALMVMSRDLRLYGEGSSVDVDSSGCVGTMMFFSLISSSCFSSVAGGWTQCWSD